MAQRTPMTTGEARALLDTLASEYGLPATDPVRFGVDGLVDRIVADFPEI